MAVPLRKPQVVHPPGTILQHLYVKERLIGIPSGTFVEVGVGSGHLSYLLLCGGWSGTGYDLSASSLARTSELTASFIASGRFAVCHADWLLEAEVASVDLVVSSMVLEHLDDDGVRRYFERARAALRPNGLGIILVPSSPRHWGIEDEIAGHYRRYTADSLSATVRQHGWRVQHVAGLTYPLSNMLLRLSDILVRRAEQARQVLPLQERTKHSGDRNVAWKTNYPPWAGALINETTLRPFHWLQRRHRSDPNALVLYCECLPPDPDDQIPRLRPHEHRARPPGPPHSPTVPPGR
jgi:SAM-dependent methyltransferase